MIKKLSLFFAVILILAGNMAKADEGMWIPMLLKKYNIDDMQKAGFQLSADDIYNINQACLKDAVVGLGREGSPFHHFCTGELISDQGLLVTNHHCGYGAIQNHSTLEHDYLKDGFWAMNKTEELVNEGITASFLVRMEDVTKQVLDSIAVETKEEDRQKIIQKRIRKIQDEAEKDSGYRASVKPFFNDNQYFLSVYEIYKDVRLVGAPPSAIGKFGGDTDNWMWPRHTGDFSLFRIYANKDNKPASYSKENVPLQPKQSFKISLKGVNEGDFTMVFGYPGTTTEYLTSYALEMLTKVNNPHKIKIRTKKLDLMRVDMDASPLVRIQYSAKYAGVANSWKRWQGEITGLNRLNAIVKKQELEERFQNWANSNEELQNKYSGCLPELKELYAEIEPYSLARDYALEAGFRGSEVVGFALQFKKLIGLKKGEQDNMKEELESLKKSSNEFFKNYNQPTDKNLLAATLQMYAENLSDEFLPQAIKDIRSKYHGNFQEYAEKTLKKSIFGDQKKISELLDSYHLSMSGKVTKDPIYQLANSISSFYLSKIDSVYSTLDRKIVNLQRKYMAGLMEMDQNKVFYPDANSTFRVHYGKVAGYKARNAVNYDFYTTLDGIIEKDNPEIFDYDVPQKLRDLYTQKDFGKYSNSKGEMPVCFAATNHTTGGNSGSPVLNAKGELIGLNFDRAWEGVMSDLMYDAEICRNVSLDIRYVLFIIDKFAGASYLLDEMQIIE